MTTCRNGKLLFSKFAAVWFRRETSLELTFRTMLVIQTFIFDMNLNWKPKRPIYQDSHCDRL